MNDYDKIYTLEEFWKNVNLPDGLYAVWVNELIFDEKEVFNGFSATVLNYSARLGFEDSPDWMEKFDDRQIKVRFLEELKL